MWVECGDGVYRCELIDGAQIRAYHAIVGDEATLFVDAGDSTTPRRLLESKLPGLQLRRGRRVYVVITHHDVDHAGGVRAFSAMLPEAIIVAHAADTDWIQQPAFLVRQFETLRTEHSLPIPQSFLDWVRAHSGPCTVELPVTGGEVLDLGGRQVLLMHVPGHTPGSLAVFDVATCSLVSGDAVQDWDTVRAVASHDAPVYADAAGYVQSLRAIAAIRPQSLYASHLPVARGAASDAVVARAACFPPAVEDAVLATLARANRPLGALEVAVLVAPHLGPWRGQRASGVAYAVLAHVRDLMHRGLVAEIAHPLPRNYYKVGARWL